MKKLQYSEVSQLSAEEKGSPFERGNSMRLSLNISGQED